MKGKLGILGGMGPLASAEFLRTLYRLNVTEPEQESPVCLMISDPGFPDRTEAILRGSTGEVTARLGAALRDLLKMGADRIVIACFTVHHMLDEVPPELRSRVASLIDLTIDHILASPRQLLLLTTTGTEKARIFERHPRWETVAGWVKRPSAEDQEALHGLLYRLKKGESGEDSLDWLAGLPSRYGAEGAIFGCTELHLLHEAAALRMGEEAVVDPLFLVARSLEPVIREGALRASAYGERPRPATSSPAPSPEGEGEQNRTNPTNSSPSPLGEGLG